MRAVAPLTFARFSDLVLPFLVLSMGDPAESIPYLDFLLVYTTLAPVGDRADRLGTTPFVLWGQPRLFFVTTKQNICMHSQFKTYLLV